MVDELFMYFVFISQLQVNLSFTWPLKSSNYTQSFSVFKNYLIPLNSSQKLKK